jgi:hypothetical protein
MVIWNGAGYRAGLVHVEHSLQSVMFIANLIFGHFGSMPLGNVLCLVHCDAPIKQPHLPLHLEQSHRVHPGIFENVDLDTQMIELVKQGQ